MARSESIDIRNIVQTEQIIYRNVYIFHTLLHTLYTHTYMHITTINEKGGHGLKRARKNIWEGVKRGEERA